MTLVASWVRQVNCKRDEYELIIVSDSRLGGGIYWDQCPKLMKFDRTDCVMGFAKDTRYSYPFMLQLNNVMTEYSKVHKGTIDFLSLKGHFIRSLNAMTVEIDNQTNSQDEGIETFCNQYIFAGYDWRKKDFIIKTIAMEPSVPRKMPRGKEFSIDGKKWELAYGDTEICHEYRDGKLKQNGSLHFKNFKDRFGEIGIIGDKREQYIQKLELILKQKYGLYYEGEREHKFDMEPLEALCLLLNDEKRNKSSSIGGAPQMLKVYPYMQSTTVGVYWPERIEDLYQNRTIMGRKLLPYEETDYQFWDIKANRAFPCRDGMNKYIDMFNDIRIRYTLKGEKIQIKVIKNRNKYLENCSFNINGNVTDISFNDSFKIQLTFNRKNNKHRVFPMWDYHEYYVPDKAMFVDGSYEITNQLKDMFTIIEVHYANCSNGDIEIKLNKSKSNNYSNFCEFTPSIATGKPGQEFFVRLKYDIKGKETCKVEPSKYIKYYRIPNSKSIYKEEQQILKRNKEIATLIGIIANYRESRIKAD